MSRHCALAVAGTLLLAISGTVSKAGEPAAASSAMPDFTGVWRISEALTPVTPGAPGAISVEAVLLKLRRDLATRIAAELRRGPVADRGYCAPAAFTGPLGYGLATVGVFPVNFEILSSPGRLTLIDELGVVRRLYLRTTPPADALDESNAGTSIARWDGSQLVVQTTGLNSTARVVIGIPGTELGHNARIEEKFSMPQAGVLQVVTTVTAPELFAAPMTTTNRYKHDANGTMLEISTCSTGDRAYDLTTGKERFDATPPGDLPPPPK